MSKIYALEGHVVDRNAQNNGKGWCENVSPTLNTQDRHAVVYALEGNGSRPSHQGSGFSDCGKMYTLNTIEQHSVCYAVENHPNDSRVTIDPDGIVQTLSSRMGTGGNNTPFVLIAFDAYQHHNWRQAETIGPLTTNCSATVRGDTPIVLMTLGGTNSREAIVDGDKSTTLMARAGTGGGNAPIVLIKENT